MLNSTFKIAYLVGLIIASVIRIRFTFRYRSKKYKVNRDTLADHLFLSVIGLEPANDLPGQLFCTVLIKSY